jgi:hypothetical protein
MYKSTPLDHLQSTEVRIHLRTHVELVATRLQAVGPVTATHHWPRIVSKFQIQQGNNQSLCILFHTELVPY